MDVPKYHSILSPKDLLACEEASRKRLKVVYGRSFFCQILSGDSHTVLDSVGNEVIQLPQGTTFFAFIDNSPLSSWPRLCGYFAFSVDYSLLRFCKHDLPPCEELRSSLAELTLNWPPRVD